MNIQVLIGRLKSLVHDPITSATLVNELEVVDSIVHFVEVNDVPNPHKIRMLDLQELLYNLDDLIDKFQAVYGMHRNIFFVKNLSCLLPETRVLNDELQTIIRALNEMKPELKTLSEFDSRPRGFVEKKAYSLYSFDESHFFGRYTEVEELVNLALGGKVSLVSIVGPLGIGKSTLASCIYNDKRISEHFVRVWVSEDSEEHEHFNIFVRGSDLARDPRSRITKSEIKQVFDEFVAGSRYFLVLDDICTAVCWSLLRAIEDPGYKRSVIIVNTRSRSLASSLGAGRAHVYRLKRLSIEASYEILKRGVLGSVSFEKNPAFVRSLKEIAELSGGFPILLSTFSENLDTFLTTGVGDDLGRQEAWSSDKIAEVFTPYYDRLPSHLKLPFQTFFLRKACGLSLEALTCLWMALGFLYPPDTQAPTQMLDLGKRYLREFAESDLASDVEYAPGGVIRDIHMDDHILGVGISKSRKEWVIVRGRLYPTIDKMVRYIIWVEDPASRTAVPSGLLKARKSRLFILHTRGPTSAELVRGIISGFKLLRVLGLGGCNIEKLPRSIGYLKHLRYLDLGRNARLKRLPPSISKLWHLQTLFLHGCEQLEEIPSSIGKLKNLIYLTLTTLQKTLPEEIGKLTSLQTLGLSGCQRLASLPLCIKNLSCLQTLAIVDCPQLDLVADSSVEALKENESIETLLLRELPKFVGFPSDVGAFCVSVKHLVIQSCRILKETVWIKLLKPLHSLTIEDSPDLSLIMDGTVQFDSLLELVIRRCPSLDSTAWVRQFMSLQSLIINGCPNLVGLDAGFSGLKYLQRLEISGCPYLTVRCAKDGEDWQLIEHVGMIELDGVKV